MGIIPVATSPWLLHDQNVRGEVGEGGITEQLNPVGPISSADWTGRVLGGLAETLLPVFPRSPPTFSQRLSVATQPPVSPVLPPGVKEVSLPAGEARGGATLSVQARTPRQAAPSTYSEADLPLQQVSKPLGQQKAGTSPRALSPNQRRLRHHAQTHSYSPRGHAHSHPGLPPTFPKLESARPEKAPPLARSPAPASPSAPNAHA